jgi:hypothetical protein
MPKPFNRWGFPQFVLFTLAVCCDINTGKHKALCSTTPPQRANHATDPAGAAYLWPGYRLGAAAAYEGAHLAFLPK